MAAPTRGRWRVLQLADSAFPAGGFAHSGGLEAALALGEAAGEAGVRAFAARALWQAGTFALPFVGAARDLPGLDLPGLDLPGLDRRCEAAQGSHVARRASRQQGRAWLRTCREAFGVELAAALPHGHLPIAFGATAAALALDADDAREVYLHQVARGVVSAAVRLGALGPHAAQRLHDGLGAEAAAVLAACAGRTVDDAAHSAPLEELFGALHDELPARLFQS